MADSGDQDGNGDEVCGHPRSRAAPVEIPSPSSSTPAAAGAAPAALTPTAGGGDGKNAANLSTFQSRLLTSAAASACVSVSGSSFSSASCPMESSLGSSSSSAVSSPLPSEHDAEAEAKEVAESKDEHFYIEEKVVDGRVYPPRQRQDYRDARNSSAGEESVAGNSGRVGAAEEGYESRRLAVTAPTVTTAGAAAAAAAAAAAVVGSADITRPQRAMESCEGDVVDGDGVLTMEGMCPDGERGATVVVVEGVPMDTAVAATAASGSPRANASAGVARAGTRTIRSAMVFNQAPEGSSPGFHPGINSAFGGVDSGNGGGIGRGDVHRWPGRSASSGVLWPDGSWRDYLIDGESVSDQPRVSRGFGRSASWRARMNQPLAWDPVVIRPPSTSTAEEENDNGDENYFISGGALGASGASPAAASVATESAVVASSAGRESSITQQAVGGNSSLIRPRQGSSVGLSQAGTRPWTRGRERDGNSYRSADSSLGSSVSRPRLVGGVDEEDEEEGEACFEAFNVSEDVIAAILGNLDARDLARAAATSRGWKRCTSSRPLWRAIYARDFLGHVPSAACSAVAGTNGRNPGGDHHALLPGSLGSAPSAAAAAAASAAIGRGVGGGSGDLSTWSTLGRFAPSGHPQSYNPFSGSGGLVGHRFDRNMAGNALGGSSSMGGGSGNAGGIGWGVGGGGRGLFFWGSGGGGGSSSSNSSGVFYSAPTGLGVCPALEDNPKEQYAKQLTERRARLERQQKQDVLREARKRADRRRRRYERALDCLHVRLLPPLMGASLALTLVFLAAWIDGDLKKWDYWRVLSPMWIACGVASLSAATAVHAWRQRTIATSSLRSTYAGLRGAVRYFMTEVVQDQAIGVASGVALLVFSMLQLVTIGLRIEGLIHTNWFVVFAPLLLCFLILCFSPCLQWSAWGESGAYLVGMLLGWTPAVLCILLVCSRLEGDNVSMSVVMAPLWVVDLVLVLAPVAMAATVAVRRLRHGEPVDAMLLHTLAASWCLLTPVLAPVVAFEIALAVYVEGERDNLTAAEVFTPLVVWCCVLFLILCGYSCSHPSWHPESLEGTFDHDPTFAPTPTGLATRLPRPRTSGSTVGGVNGFGGVVGVNGGGVTRNVGRNRRRPLQFPPSNMSPDPGAGSTAPPVNHPPRPLTPAPHANGLPPDMADVIALRSQLAELGMMAAFYDPSSSSPPLGVGRRGGGIGTPSVAFSERRVQ